MSRPPRLSVLASLRLALLLLPFLPLLFASPAQAAPEYVAGEVLIRFRDQAPQSDVDAVLHGLGATNVRTFPDIHARQERLSGITVEEAIARYRNHPQVLYIEPNYIVRADRVPNDPLFGQLWGMQNTGQTGGTAGADISATRAWDVSTGSGAVLIGIIDTGLDYNHPDLAANVWTNPGEIAGNGIDDDGNGYVDDVHGYDFYNNDSDPYDDHGHGTHVAGTIGAVGDNGEGVAGVTWGVKIIALKFLGAGGSGSTADAIRAIEYATTMGVRLTSNSWGGGDYSQALYDAIQVAGSQGILFVAAAGNSGDNNDLVPHYPSSYDLANIVAVAATDHNDALAPFSCYGATSVDLAAPGVDILSTWPGNSYNTISGTSMATPHVSGALALVFARFPAIGGAEAKQLLLLRADPKANLAGRMVSGARLNAFMPISEPDSVAPAAIADLAVQHADGSWVELAWTTTGDDSLTGRASSYDMRYSTAPITAENFDAAAQAAGEPSPLLAGSPQQMRVQGLDFATSYYFALKAADEFGNASPISNVVGAATLAPPHLTYSPDSLAADLFTGGTAARTLTLGNTGASELAYRLSFSSEAAPGAAPRITRHFSATPAGGGAAAAPGPSWAGDRAPLPAPLRADQLRARDVRAASSSMRILLVYSGGDPSQIRGLLAAYPDVAVVDQFDALNGTPTLDLLRDYTAVITLAGYVYSDPAALGDVLADYVDQGGGVVMTVASFVAQWSVTGRFLSGGYMPFENGFGPIGSASLGVYDAGHPIMDGVVSAWGDLLASATLAADAQLVASWDNGQPFVATRGTRVAAVNIFVAEGGYWNGDIPLILRNAAAWSGGAGPWLAADPDSGIVPAGTQADITVTFDATGRDGGDYLGGLLIASNDPTAGTARVPAHLHVTGAPDIALSDSVLDLRDVFTGFGRDDTLLVSNRGTDLLNVSGVSVVGAGFSADPAGFDLPPRGTHRLIVHFAPLTPVPYEAMLWIASNDPDTPVAGVQLTGRGLVPPDIALAPDSLGVDLLVGARAERTLTLTNSGGSDLLWQLGIEETGALRPVARQTDGPKDRLPMRSRDVLRTYTPERLNHAGAAGPVDAVRATFGDLAGQPRILLYADDCNRPAGSMLSDLALQALGLPYTAYYYDPFAFAQALAAGPWDLVVVENDCYYFSDYWAALDTYVRGGGRLLVTTYDVDGSSASPLWQAIGLAAAGDISVASPVFWWEPLNRLFNHPETVPPFTQMDEVYYDDGDRVSPAAVASSPAGFTPLPGAGQSAIVISPSRKAIANTFIVSENSRDLDDDGKLDGAELFENQIDFLIHGAAWLTAEPASGVLAAGASLEIPVRFDATGLLGGDYQADLVVRSNDPDEPELRAVARLHVTGAPDITLSEVALDFGGWFVGAKGPDTLIVSNDGTDLLKVKDVIADPAVFEAEPTVFEVAPGATQRVLLWFVPTAVQDYAGSLTLLSNDPDEDRLVLALHGLGLAPPQIALSPASLSASLFTGERATRTLTVSNVGASDLVFTASSEAAGGAALQARIEAGGEVLARGRAVAPGSAAQAGVASSLRVTADQLSARDETMGGTPGGLPGGAPPTTPRVLGEEVFGGMQNSYFAGPRTRGNVFHCTTSEVLTEHRFYLQVQTPSQLWFLVYEGLEPVGTYQLISAANVSPALPGQGWYSSGPVDVRMQAGRYYLIVASFEQPSGYFNQTDVSPYPFPASFGELIAGAGWDWAPTSVFPPDPAQYVPPETFGSAAAYYQTLVTRGGVAWLTATPDAGTVAPGAHLDLTVTFDAARLFGGDYHADVVIRSNDPDDEIARIPADLHVTGAPDVALSDSLLDFGSLFVGDTRTDTLLVHNLGTDSLRVTQIQSDEPAFTLDHAALTVPPEQTASLLVTFAPLQARAFLGTLSMQTNDPDQPALGVPLRGVAQPPPDIAWAPDSFAVDLFTGGREVRTLTLSNTGQSELSWSLGIETRQAAGPAAAKAAASTARLPVTSWVELGPPGPPVNRVTAAAPFAAPAQAIRAVYGDSVAAPRILLYSDEPTSAGYHYSDLALQALGLPYTAYYWYPYGFAQALAYGDSSASGDWDLVVIDHSAYYGEFWTEAEDYVRRGGRLLVSTADVDGDYSEPTTLWQTLGLSYRNDILAVSPVYWWQSAHPFFNSPESVPPFSQMYDYWYDNGDRVEPLPGAASVAGFVPAPAPDQSGIVISPTGRAVVNSFVVSENYADLDADGKPDGAELFENEIVFLSQHWLSAEPRSGVIAPGDSAAVGLTFEAARLNGGDYFADLVVASNDPDESSVRIPARLHVTGAPDLTLSDSLFDFGSPFVGALLLDTLHVGNAGTDVLQLAAGLEAGSSPYFTVTPAALTLPVGASGDLIVAFHPLAAGPAGGTIRLASNDPDEAVVLVPLHGVGLPPPDIALSPDSLVAAVFSGEPQVRTLTIANQGQSDLNWNLRLESIHGAAAAATVWPSAAWTPTRWEVIGPAAAPGANPPRSGSVAPAEAVRAVYGDSLPARRILLFSDELGSAGYHYSDRALQALGLPYTAYYYYPYGFAQDLAGGTWDLVIIDHSYYYGEFWTEAESYVRNGGRLLVTTYDVDGSSSEPTTLWQTLGVGARGDLLTPPPLYWWDPSHVLFHWPESVPAFTQMTDYWYDDGDRVAPLGGATSPAGFAPAPGPDQSGIVISESRRAVVNSFVLSENFADLDGDGKPDGVELFVNEISYLLDDVPWLSAPASSGTVAAGAHLDLPITFDPLDLQGGDYRAKLLVGSNDPDEPLLEVPAHMHLTGAPNLVVAPAFLDFGSLFVGATRAESLLVSNNGNDLLVVSDIASSDAAFTASPASFSLAPHASQSVLVRFTPTSPAVFQAVLTIASNDPNDPSMPVTLLGTGLVAPEAAVTPDSVDLILAAGDSTARVLALSNPGGSDLVWHLALTYGGGGAVLAASPVFAPAPAGGESGRARAAAATRPADTERYRMDAPRTPPVPEAAGAPPGSESIVPHTPLEDVLAHFNQGYAPVIAAIPGRYDFTEGVTGTSIADGGLDMYDGGNYLNTAFGGPFEYSDGPILTHTALGPGGRYFTRKVPGLFVLAADVNGVDEFLTTGNLGADGFGSVDGAILATTVRGVPYLGFVKRVFGASNPSVNHLVIVPADSGMSQEFYAYSSDNDYHSVRGLARTGRIYYLLYAGNYGGYIDNAATLEIMNRFLESLRLTPNWVTADLDQGVVPAGASQDITLRFRTDNLTVGSYRATADVVSNDPVRPHLPVPVTLRVTGAAALRLSATSLDFGTVPVGATRTRVLEVYNVGTDVLEVSAVQAGDPAFHAVPASFSVAPQDSQQVVVSFTPAAQGPLDVLLTFTSNDPGGAATVALHGAGGLAPRVVFRPDSLHVDMPPFWGDARTFTVANTGAGDLEWSLVPDYGAGSRVPPTSLEDVFHNLNVNYQRVVNAIPERYDFSEGFTGTSITDGGLDMYDGGNILTTPLGGPLAYSDGVIIGSSALGTGGRYFTRKFPGLWVFAADIRELPDFIIGGDLGADGAGTVDGTVLETTVRGATWRGFVKRVSGSANPSVNHLFIVPADAGVTQEFSFDSNSDLHVLHHLESTRQFYYVLYAGRAGAYIDDAATLGIMTQFLEALQLRAPWLLPTPDAGLVPPGGSVDVNLGFDASEYDVGLYSASLRLRSDDPAAPDVGVPAEMEITNLPILWLSPDTLGFGPVGVGGSRTLTVGFYNPFVVSARITSLTSTLADFQPDQSTFIVQSGDSVVVHVTFTPAATGPRVADLVAAGNAIHSPLHLPLRGEGVPPAQAAFAAEDLPLSFALHAAMPNPGPGTTNLRYDLPKPTSVRLEICDPAGRHVRTLVDGWMPAGRQSAPWDGRDDAGNIAAPGVYLYRLKAGDFGATRKLVLMK